MVCIDVIWWLNYWSKSKAYPVHCSSRSTFLWFVSGVQRISSGLTFPWCCWDPARGLSSTPWNSASRYILQLPPAPARAAGLSSRAGARWCQSDRGSMALGSLCEKVCSSWRPHLHSPGLLSYLYQAYLFQNFLDLPLTAFQALE